MGKAPLLTAGAVLIAVVSLLSCILFSEKNHKNEDYAVYIVSNLYGESTDMFEVTSISAIDYSRRSLLPFELGDGKDSDVTVYCVRTKNGVINGLYTGADVYLYTKSGELAAYEKSFIYID